MTIVLKTTLYVFVYIWDYDTWIAVVPSTFISFEDTQMSYCSYKWSNGSNFTYL